jgi:hypothetical protein
MKLIIKGDKSWVYRYNVKIKQHFLQWMSSSPQLMSAKELIECEYCAHCFLCLSRFSAIEFIPKRSNSESRILPVHLMSSIRGHEKEMTRTLEGTQLVSSPQCSLACTIPSPQVHCKKPNSCIPEPPYSSDLSASKFFFFPKLNISLKDVYLNQ